MSDLFGFSRTVVKPRYALVTPDGFVPSNLPGWKNAVVVINISPAMNGPRCSQLPTKLGEPSSGEGNTGALEHFYYLLAGSCRVQIGAKKFELKAGGYVFLPPKTGFKFAEATQGTRVLLFQKKFEPLAGEKTPGIIVGNESAVKGQPF